MQIGDFNSMAFAEEKRIRTGPKEDGPFVFAAGGDIGIEEDIARPILQQIAFSGDPSTLPFSLPLLPFLFHCFVILLSIYELAVSFILLLFNCISY